MKAEETWRYVDVTLVKGSWAGQNTRDKEQKITPVDWALGDAKLFLVEALELARGNARVVIHIMVETD